MSAARRAVIFLALCFGVTWLASFLGFVLLQQHHSVAAQVTLAFMITGPGVSALACAILFERGRRASALGIRIRTNWWWPLAYVLGIAYSGIALAVTIFIGRGVFMPPANLPQFTASFLLINPAVQIALATLTEELGWRGYLYGLWRRFGFWRYSLGTGLIWGLWHAPGIVVFKINYPGHPLAGAAFFVLYCMLLAPLVTLVRDHSGSVLAAGIFHGTLNATSLAIIMLAKSPSPLWQGDTGIGGFTAAVLLLTVVALFRRGNTASFPYAHSGID